jgi:hypothetical protein
MSSRRPVGRETLQWEFYKLFDKPKVLWVACLSILSPFGPPSYVECSRSTYWTSLLDHLFAVVRSSDIVLDPMVHEVFLEDLVDEMGASITYH